MERETSTISLLEELKTSGFRSSVITTYNCYFPFYEDVVLRRLIASGCTHNILFVDADRCAEAYANEHLRPRRAGRDYTLIPVHTGGAFHPKILLRLGKSKGALFVGSHNLTLSGFGLNDELTNAFRAEGGSARNAAEPFRQVIAFLAQYVPTELPDVVEAFDGIKLGIPWLEGTKGSKASDRTLLTSSNQGTNLWFQVLPLVPQDVSTVFACAPFFDPHLVFVRRILQDVRPKELIIGIDPESVEINPDEVSTLAGVRFVNVAGIPRIADRRKEASPYLHAKLFWFSGAESELLVTGSANASVAAFLAETSKRNAEAVVADRRAGSGTLLGIEEFLAAPPITSADWHTISERQSVKSESKTGSVGRRVLLATPIEEGFLVEHAIASGTVFRAYGDAHAYIGNAYSGDESKSAIIKAEEQVRDNARILEAQGHNILVVVHRSEEIAQSIGSDTRKNLRQALGALEEDPAQLESLLKITEKVIFDSEDIVSETRLRVSNPREPGAESGQSPTSLALDATGRRGNARKRRMASGDIVVLLEALMRKLGEGLGTESATGTRVAAESADIDEEDGGDLGKAVPEYEHLAKTCQGKVRRLINRMGQQLENAATEERARRCIVQLAAVLGILRALSAKERQPEWRTRKVKLVNPDDKWQLFKRATIATMWGSKSLARCALVETEGEPFEELSMVIGQLAWLAWEVEIDVETSAMHNGQQGVDDDTWRGAQLFASIASWLALDDDALRILRESVARTPRYRIDGDHWVRVHVARANQMAEIVTGESGGFRTGRMPQPGDLVLLAERFDPRIRVILNTMSTRGDAKLVCFDADDETGQREFMASRVATAAWE